MEGLMEGFIGMFSNLLNLRDRDLANNKGEIIVHKMKTIRTFQQYGKSRSVLSVNEIVIV